MISAISQAAGRMPGLMPPPPALASTGTVAPPSPIAAWRDQAPRTQLRIEPALQLVVMEFRKADGDLLRSIPTPREIDAYRMAPSTDAESPALDVTR